MTPRKLGRFVAQNIGRNRKNLVFAGIGIVVGVSSFVFFTALGGGIRRVVSTQIFPRDANRITAVPLKSGFDGPARIKPLDDAAVKALEALPDVASVYPRMRLAVPATMSLVGSRFPAEELARIARLPGVTPDIVESVKRLDLWLEIMADGIDPRLVKDEVQFGAFADPPEGQPLPFLLSKRLVEIYNSSFAESRHLPLISEIIIPFVPSMPLTLNDSYVNRGMAGPQESIRVRIVGTSQQALLGGITLPLATVRAINRRFGGEAAAARFDSAVVEARSADRIAAVQAAVRALGFGIDTSQQRMADGVALAVTLVMLGFTLISLTIVGVAAVNIGAPINNTPVVAIASPANNTTVPVGTVISFAATATDIEDGALTAVIAWRSNIDGAIGTGGAFSRTLTAGTHVVTASATDSGARTGAASVTVNVQAPPPANDPCSGSILLTNGIALSGTTASATNDGTSTCGSSTTSPDAWFRYTTTGTSTVTIDTCGSLFDTVLSVHTGACGALVQTVCNDNNGSVGPCPGGTTSYLTFVPTANTTYLIRIAGFGGARGNYTVRATGGVPTTAAPAAPTGLGVRIRGGAAALTWSDRSTNETLFRIERQQLVGATWTNTALLSVPANSRNYSDPVGAGTWRWRIRAENAGGASAWTAYAQLTLP